MEVEASFRLRVGFSDGREGRIDLARVVRGEGPMVEPLREPSFFGRVVIERGALVWPNGFDVAPGWLHREMERAGSLTPPLAA